MAQLSKAYFCVIVGEDDGVCMSCKKPPPSDDVISCNTCATRWHLPCLAALKTTSDALRLDHCPHCCSLCMQLLDTPITTPCGHSFCLKCFKKWISEGKRSCAYCGNEIPKKMARQPRINTELVSAIRFSKASKSSDSGAIMLTTETRDNKKGAKSGACGGEDHFGPINGVMVGERWENRMGCRQWGVHAPIVGGVAGKSGYGAQSVVLVAGYEDDEDHGDWFLYTGSDERDLGGDKYCASDEKPFDQKFQKLNEALRVSCLEGYPVRVVRSYKERGSCYAPETGLRYDGIYRIEKCWRKIGVQGYKVCRYLFVRCDNEPAPWTTEDNGDRPRPLPVIEELENAFNLTETKGLPSWDYDEREGCWLWKRTPPHVKKQMDVVNAEDATHATRVIRQTQILFLKVKLLEDFSCYICREILDLPLTTPCGHSFCKACLLGAFSGQSFFRKTTFQLGRRCLPSQNDIILKCPSCLNDIADYLLYPHVNREMMNEIESVKEQIKEMEEQNENDWEEESSNKRRNEEESVICVLNRQQTIDEFLQDSDDVDP